MYLPIFPLANIVLFIVKPFSGPYTSCTLYDFTMFTGFYIYNIHHVNDNILAICSQHGQYFHRAMQKCYCVFNLLENYCKNYQTQTTQYVSNKLENCLRDFVGKLCAVLIALIYLLIENPSCLLIMLMLKMYLHLQKLIICA